MLFDYLGRSDWKAAARRWAMMRQDHQRTLSKLAQGQSPDTERRVLAAAERTSDMAPTLAAEAGEAKASRLASWLGARGRERIIGGGDFEPVSFFEVGLAVSRAVCFVEVKDRIGGSLVRGTGFLVAPGVMLTNHHVIMSAAEAQDTLVTFDYRNDPRGTPAPTTVFALDPGRLFLTAPDLDCSFVAVGARLTGSQALAAYPWMPLVGVEGKVRVGDPVNIIQHPRGEPMQFVIRGNRLLLLPELAELRDHKTFAHYEADTLPGSSGAPVTSRMWEVIALHHQAVPAVDRNGNVLDVNDQPYSGDDDTRVKWLGNEGVRVTALVRFLEGCRQQVRGAQSTVLETVLAATRPDYIDMALRTRQSVLPENAFSGAGGMQMTGRLEFTLPLKVTISLGDATAQPVVDFAATTPAVAPAPQPAQPALKDVPMSAGIKQSKDKALQELERSRTRVYFDAAAADAARAAYYQGVDLGDDNSANFAMLSQLVTDTHVTKPRYAPARELYPWIDLHKEGRRLVIKSIYSGRVFDAQEFIEEAFRVEARREAMRSSMRLNEMFSAVPESAVDDLLEANAPFNCEHVVPQSWFSKKEPMRGDLHHLFACESGCNSFRGNHAYFDFPDQEAIRDMCGRREEDRFEPDAGKGAVARATLYFLLRYPGSVDLDISQMDDNRVATLRIWHKGDPVSVYERHRNQAIFDAQGNRNPFIDHEDWVEGVDFSAGLA